MEVIIINNQEDIDINENKISLVANFVFSQFEKDESSELNIALVGKDEIREINKKYRHIDKPTDVLSFSYRTDKDIFGFMGDEKEFRKEYGFFTVGEILLCPAVAKDNLKEYGDDWSLERLLVFLIIHGILHIYGHEHDSDEDRQNMENEQLRLLKLAEKEFTAF
ncbi:MAG TPA: rRNA maturation RNase YbeY [Actinobacteria bacterium]|nr:rRNA maturation RNase YbeY [Actinomycetota bacterium]